MSMAFLDGDSDYAVALREPALLVPGQKPLGRVELSQPADLFFLLDGEVRDLSTSKTYPFGGTSHTWVPYGVSVVRSPVSVVSLGTGIMKQLTNSSVPEWTLVFRWSNFSSTGTQFQNLCVSAAGGGTFCGLQIDGYSSSVNLLYSRDYSSSNIGAFVGAPTTDIPQNLVIQRRDGYLYAYVDGVLKGSTLATTAGSDRTPAYNYIYGAPALGSASGNPNTIQAIFHHTAFYTSRVGAQRLSVDPYMFLRSANQSPYLYSVGGTAAAAPAIVMHHLNQMRKQ